MFVGEFFIYKNLCKGKYKSSVLAVQLIFEEQIREEKKEITFFVAKISQLNSYIF